MRTYLLPMLALTFSLVACTTDPKAPPKAAEGTESVENAPAPPKDEVAAAPTTAAPAQPSPTTLEHSALEAGPPFVVTLTGPEKPPESGAVDLAVVIDAPKEFKVPATITVTLPKGAKLVSGQERESLTSVPAGKTNRSYKVSLTSKLDEPIRIAVDAKDPGGAMGAHAERLYPEPAAASKGNSPSSKVPPPPVGRPVGKPPTR